MSELSYLSLREKSVSLALTERITSLLFDRQDRVLWVRGMTSIQLGSKDKKRRLDLENEVITGACRGAGEGNA